MLFIFCLRPALQPSERLPRRYARRVSTPIHILYELFQGQRAVARVRSGRSSLRGGSGRARSGLRQAVAPAKTDSRRSARQVLKARAYARRRRRSGGDAVCTDAPPPRIWPSCALLYMDPLANMPTTNFREQFWFDPEPGLDELEYIEPLCHYSDSGVLIGVQNDRQSDTLSTSF
jgi:hypothetical protein